MAIDTLLFRDDGQSSFVQDPMQNNIRYCGHCKSWHAKLQLDSGIEFCAFCNTTHHSRACRAGLGEACPDPSIDHIHSFLVKECSKHQKLDLNFCKECNCSHSKQGWNICLENNKPQRNWSQKKKSIWKTRRQACAINEESSVLRSERSLFNLTDLVRTVPFEYPFSNGRFVHHCNV
ncbi:MAG: hypothetical protein ACREBS_10080 [Nitrososphaerales archaeon]